MLVIAVVILVLRFQGKEDFLCVGSVVDICEAIGAISRLTLLSVRWFHPLFDSGVSRDERQHSRAERCSGREFPYFSLLM